MSLEDLDYKDLQLFKLVQLCKETENYQKLVSVGLALISNLSIEMSLDLGLSQRDIMKSPEIYKRFNLVSAVYKAKFQIDLFEEAMMAKLREIEVLYEKNKKKIPREYIINLFEIYFRLKDLNVPSIQGSSKVSGSPFLASLRNLQRFSNAEHGSQDLISIFAENRIDTKIQQLQENLKHEFNNEEFAELIRLSYLKSSLHQNKRGGKLEVKSNLKDSIYSKTIFTQQIEFFFLAILITVLGVGFVMLAEVFFFPFLLESLSILLFAPFGIAFIMFIFYWKFFMEER
ncbi:MAG: hypothetical protein BAJALOKI2v1_540004 [Promethearchaeota archaeon]|nr:MAG: hypothetical protein BAJALOKI2v1_540004 [Candidatus Lokiarchaeota archaeon]